MTWRHDRDLQDMSAPLVLVSARDSTDVTTAANEDAGLSDVDTDGPCISGAGSRALFVSVASDLVTGKDDYNWTIYAKGLSVASGPSKPGKGVGRGKGGGKGKP